MILPPPTPRLVAALLALVVPALGAAAAEALLSIPAIKAMTKAEAAAGVPARVRGVVIETETHGFVLHDGREGLFVKSHAREAVPPYGRAVIVEGVTDPGEFAPVILAERITTLGEGEVTPRRITAVAELELGSLDCQWVEVEGLLRSALPGSPAEPCYSAYAVLSSGTTRLNLSFSTTTVAEVQAWVGSRVRVRAACGHYFNSHGQLYGARLIVPRSAEVQVIAAAVPREAVPVVRIDSLLRYSPQEQPEGRVQIRGVVTYHRGEGELYLQQDRRGVYVQHFERRSLAVGDVIDVVGFVRRGVCSPEIEDAEAVPVGEKADVAARPVSIEDAKGADSELVEVNGVLLDYFRGAETAVLTLKAEGAPFTAVLPLPSGAPELPAAGSLVQLTGVVRAMAPPVVGTPFPWKPASFELRMRSAHDLRVLKRPAVGLVVWVFGGATALSSLALLIAGSLWWRSRTKLREQKMKRFAREAEFAGMMKERMRLAREIHDNLAQGFTAVSIQLEMAKHKLPAEPTLALGHVEGASALVRESLAAARRSIQGMRLETRTSAEFLATLDHFRARILKDTEIAFHHGLEGDLRQLGGEVQSEFLSIATEAMTNTVRHAQAKNIHVTCRVRDGYGELRVSDDGIGILPGAPLRPGFGLRGMHERAHRLNGHLVVTSEPDRGTHLVVRVPLESHS